MESTNLVMVDNEIKQRVDSPFVFISHDTRDAEIAEAFSRLLRGVTAGMLKSFRSSDNSSTQGIEFGTEWYPKIIEKLQSASDVVCIITDLSIDRPWILFEAGIAKSKLNTPILGVAIGISLVSASTGPFALFQNCNDDISSLTKLVNQLVKKLPNSEPDEEIIKQQVETFRQKTEEILRERNELAENVGAPNEKEDDGAAKLFEEIKIMFKELPFRIENISRKSGMSNQRKMFPSIYEDFLSSSLKFINVKVGLQIVLSPVKNDFPWLYDASMDMAEKIMSSITIDEADTQIKSFMKLLEFSTDHPLMENLIEDASAYKYLKNTSFVIEMYLREWIQENYENIK